MRPSPSHWAKRNSSKSSPRARNSVNLCLPWLRQAANAIRRKRAWRGRPVSSFSDKLVLSLKETNMTATGSLSLFSFRRICAISIKARVFPPRLQRTNTIGGTRLPLSSASSCAIMVSSTFSQSLLQTNVGIFGLTGRLTSNGVFTRASMSKIGKAWSCITSFKTAMTFFCEAPMASANSSCCSANFHFCLASRKVISPRISILSLV